MGDLTIANKSGGRPIKVSVEGDMQISTSKDEKGNNYAKTTVKNGKVKNEYKWSNKDHLTSESALNLNSKNFLIFDAMRKADKSDKEGKKFSKSDVVALMKDKTLQKQLGCKVIEGDKPNTYIIQTGSSKMFIDFNNQ